VGKVTVTYEQMAAIEEQRDRYKRHLNEVIKIVLGESEGYVKFCEGSEPLNYMSVEQIVLAWHNCVETLPKDVLFSEVIQLITEGKNVSFHFNDKVINFSDKLLISAIAEHVYNIKFVDLINGKWSIQY